jgi:hypothetical protein
MPARTRLRRRFIFPAGVPISTLEIAVPGGCMSRSIRAFVAALLTSALILTQAACALQPHDA